MHLISLTDEDRDLLMKLLQQYWFSLSQFQASDPDIKSIKADEARTDKLLQQLDETGIYHVEHSIADVLFDQIEDMDKEEAKELASMIRTKIEQTMFNIITGKEK